MSSITVPLTGERRLRKVIAGRLEEEGAIRNNEDHEAALREIEVRWGVEEGSEASDRLDMLATLVEAYEDRRWPIEPPDPVCAIEAATRMKGYIRVELTD